MNDQELKQKKEELKRMRAERERLTIDAKLEKEQKRLEELRKTDEQRERERKEREERAEALLKVQEKKAVKVSVKGLIERLAAFLIVAGAVLLCFAG